ncbi:conserved protein of unknown function [Ruminococcaceae bacterium BL-4]|jgi:hypothetical protein|nr:conserved protein of unknown function [Ruminococcaceae bacterium BL-4]
MKRKAAEGYSLIPEGNQILKIESIDEENYEKFGKLSILMKDAHGTSLKENFNFVNDDGTANDVADGIYTRLARAALDDQTADEFDTNDLIGKFIECEIVHREGSKGGTFANIKKIIGHADGFLKTKSDTPAPHKKSAAEILAEMKARREAADQK